MPIAVSKSAGRIVRFVLSGNYEFRDVLDAIQKVVEEADPAHRQIGVLDIRDSKELRTPEELRVLARALAASKRFMRVEVLVAQDLRYGLGRMLAVFAENEGLMLTVTRTSAA